MRQVGTVLGLRFLTGIVNVDFGFAGLGSAVHLAEECIRTITAVPWALVLVVLMNFFTTFFFLVVMFHSASDFQAVVNMPTK